MATPPDDDAPSAPGWQKALLGDDPGRVIGALPKYTTICCGVTREASLALYREAERLGTTREGVMRVALREYLIRNGLCDAEQAEVWVASRSVYVHRKDRRVASR